MKNWFRVFCWAVYDLADTAFSALFVTLFFPKFITEYLGGNAFHVGLVFGLSPLFAGLFVPFFGAVSDTMRRRMPFVIIFTVLCVVATGSVAFASLSFALLLGFLANFFYHAALDVYDAMLTDITTKKNIGKVSGYGVAMGYVGTILSIAMTIIIINFLHLGESIASVRSMFLATALFYLIFSLPLFLFVRDKNPRAIAYKKALKEAFNSLLHTFKTIRINRFLWIFLLISFIYMDGMNTAIVFLYLYGSNVIGLSLMQFLVVYAVMALTAIFGSWMSGMLTDKFGPRLVLIWTLVIWCAVIIALMSLNTFTVFLIAGCVGGAALGSIWTATRPMLVKLAPRKKIAELFGFQGLTEKFGAVLGPIMFGYFAVQVGYTFALIVPLSFFALSLFLFRLIPKDA